MLIRSPTEDQNSPSAFLAGGGRIVRVIAEFMKSDLSTNHQPWPVRAMAVARTLSEVKAGPGTGKDFYEGLLANV
jgi:hypothetical protein